MAAIDLRFEVPADDVPGRLGHLEARRTGATVQLIAVFYATAPMVMLGEFSTFARTLAARVVAQDETVDLVYLADGRQVAPIVQLPAEPVPDYVPSDWAVS